MTIFTKAFSDSYKTPIVSVIRAIMRLDDPNVLVLDYRRDEAAFKALWALEGNNLPTKQAGKCLLKELACADKTIILIDVDVSSVITSDKFGRHLSALSWAHCLTYSLLLAEKSVPNIVILDLRNEASVHYDATTFTDYFNLPSSKRPGNIQRFSVSLTGFAGFISHVTKLSAKSPKFDDIATFPRRWKSALVEADSRSSQHDLNNAMGPLSLAASVADDTLNAQVIAIAKDRNDQLARAAMLRAMQWIVKNEQYTQDFQPIPLKAARDLRILLLDDQAKNGWLPVLSYYLGLNKSQDNNSAPVSVKSGFQQYASASYKGETQISLWYATSPDSMVKQLTAEAPFATNKVERLRFTKDITPGSNGDFDELLLLDLRLYGGDAPDQVNKEKEFLKQVAAALNNAKNGARPTWSDQIDDEGFREKPAYLQALTGLAQLISAVDFTYPIVVWSSTGQRKVTECIREFKNVFTGLEKPRFDSYMSNADDLRISLNDACRWASKQFQAVSFFYELMALNELQSWEPPGATHPYAEVYIEEDGNSNNQNFKVGALIAFFQNKQIAENLHSRMNKKHFGSSLIQKNNQNKESFSANEGQTLNQSYTSLSFCGDGRLPKKLNFGQQGYLKDSNDNDIPDKREVVANKLSQLLNENQVQCMMLTSTLKANTPNRDIDPRYLFLLNDVLRVVFTLFLTGKEVRVFVATKRAQKNGNIAREYFEKWGLLSEVEGNNTSYYSLNNHSALHAAIDAHSYTDRINGQAELLGARGVTLSYKKSTPRPAHYEWQIFENIFQAKSGTNAGGHYVRAQLKVSGINGLQDFRNSGDALCCSFPHAISDKNSWRNLHYYADELLEEDARDTYIKAQVVAEGSWFDRSLMDDDPTKDSQLLILSCARSTLQSNFTDAIKSYALAKFSPLPDTKGNCKLRKFIGKRLAVDISNNKQRAKDAYETLLDVVEAK